MRLFVAVEAAALGAGGDAVAGELRRRAARLAPRARITWAASSDLHLTLRFLGELDEEAAARVAGALASPVDMSPFDVTVEGIGVFPPRGAPRVLWAGMTEGAEALHHLQRELSARLEVAGVPRDDRPFHPHLTLARVRDAAGLAAAPWVEGLTRARLGAISVTSCTLFESRLSGGGASHHPRCLVRLEARVS